jgi:gamma-glutamyltranspeptidase / glutathione hydrolase
MSPEIKGQTMLKIIAVFSFFVILSMGAVSQAGMVSPSEPVRATKFMAATANPYATDAALEMLRAGGSAVDAAIAAQMVLTLVEPQSSGIGGGAFMMHYDAARGTVDAYDGREKAPASATESMFMINDTEALDFYDAVVGGLSVGVPGVVRMLDMAHRERGKLPWKRLFEPAIKLARDGFPVSDRMHYLSANDESLHTFPDTEAYFFDDAGQPHPVGTILKNPELAHTLELIAGGGADAFYTGSIAESIAHTVQHAPRHPTMMTLDDLAGYEAIKRNAVCGPYRTYTVCGMPPPSSGGITTLQILGILEHFDLAVLEPHSLEAVHLIAEASRLAFADRNTYLADSDFVPHPTGMLDEGYLRTRAEIISADHATPDAEAGEPEPQEESSLAPDAVEKGLSTTHFSIVDGDGNAISMTSSIETQFGSRLMTRGFLLNNQLTDFSFWPHWEGKMIANRPGPGKRPRSSMSPTLVLDEKRDLVMAIGSPGGSSIIGYVAKTLIAALDWNLNIQQAIDLPHTLNKNWKTRLEADTPLVALKADLESMGHEIDIRESVSGLQGIWVTPDGTLEGGADPRREGVAAGD